MQPFNLEMPRRIVFGSGSLSRLPELAAGLGGRRLLLVTGSGWFTRSPWDARLRELLAGREVQRLAVPPGEPESGALDGLLARARELEPAMIVAVGGGSVLDSAKTLSGLLPLPGRVQDYLEGMGEARPIPGPGVPWVALPTTAGTGAEATKNAVVRAGALGYKRSLRSPHLLASCVLVDPELARDCPLEITGTAGMDALVQLLESYVSRKASPVTRALAREAFPVMLRALERLAARLDDLEARGQAAYGALLSGICLANGGLGAAHGFASGLGGMYDVPHGLICALCIGPVLRFNAPAVVRDIGRLAGATAEQEGQGTPDDPVEWLLAKLEALSRLYRLPRDLKGFGIRAADLPEIARRSSGSSMSGNPVEIPQAERERLLAGLL